MTALFAEAVDTAVTLGWALLQWIAVAAAVTVAGWLLVAAVAGAYTTARDALSGALAASQALRALGCVAEPHGPSDGLTAARATTKGPSDGRGSRHSAPQTPGEGFPAPRRHGRSQTHSGPSWAQPDEEAA